MPSRYSSEATRADAKRLAASLGCPFAELPIGGIVDAFAETLREQFAGRDADLAEENIQARARGVLLMALSNKFGWMLVATGNKSELSVVHRAVGMIDRAEYKRRQAPPGVKLRPRAFGRDRRTPITNRWRG